MVKTKAHRRREWIRSHGHRVIYAVYVFGVVFVFFNVVFPAASIPIMSINWYSPAQPYDWVLTPPSLKSNPAITNNTIFLYVRVESTSFVDGADLTLRATACAAAGNIGKLNSIEAGFNDSYPYPLSGIIVNGAFTGAIIKANNSSPLNPGGWGNRVGVCPGVRVSNVSEIRDLRFPEDDNEITFRSPGNYPLVAYLNYVNGTKKVAFNDNAVAIQSSASRNQGVILTAEALMAVIVGAFTVTDIVPKVREAIQRRPTQDTGAPPQGGAGIA